MLINNILATVILTHLPLRISLNIAFGSCLSHFWSLSGYKELKLTGKEI